MDFWGTEFNGKASFRFASFDDWIFFDLATFKEETIFADVIFKGYASFIGAKIKSTVFFESTEFSIVSFSFAHIIGKLDFRNVKIIKYIISFDKTDCNGSIILEPKKIEGKIDGDIYSRLWWGKRKYKKNKDLIPSGIDKDFLKKMKEKFEANVPNLAMYQYELLRNNFRNVPSAGPAEDWAHYHASDCKRRTKKSKLSRVLDWFFLKGVFGYGVKWWRLLFASLYVILISAITYGMLATPDFYTSDQGIIYTFGAAILKFLWTSFISFAGLGYGTLIINNPWMQFVAGVEGLIGFLTYSVLVVFFTRKLFR